MARMPDAPALSDSIVPCSVGRAFAEAGAIGLSETAELPEAETHGDMRDSCHAGVRPQQCRANMLEAPSACILRGALAKEFQAGKVESPSGNADCGADVGHGQHLLGAFAQRLFQPGDN